MTAIISLIFTQLLSTPALALEEVETILWSEPGVSDASYATHPFLAWPSYQGRDFLANSSYPTHASYPRSASYPNQASYPLTNISQRTIELMKKNADVVCEVFGYSRRSMALEVGEVSWSTPVWEFDHYGYMYGTQVTDGLVFTGVLCFGN